MSFSEPPKTYQEGRWRSLWSGNATPLRDSVFHSGMRPRDTSPHSEFDGKVHIARDAARDAAAECARRRLSNSTFGVWRVGETGVWALGTIESVLESLRRPKASRWNCPRVQIGPDTTRVPENETDTEVGASSNRRPNTRRNFRKFFFWKVVETSLWLWMRDVRSEEPQDTCSSAFERSSKKAL